MTPAAGESVTEGTILEWHVKVGDAIKLDDTIVEISTDKVDVELPSPASGTVTEILVAGGRHGHGRPGDRAHRRRRRGRRPQEAADDGEVTARRSSRRQRRRRDEPRPHRRRKTVRVVPDGTKVSPVAARAAAAEGVGLANVAGSGPGGKIVKSDVLGAADGAGADRQRRGGSDRRAAGGRRTAEGRKRGAGEVHGAVALDPDGDELQDADGDGAWTPAAAS